ncbi:MAG: glycosyl hydrolase family 18 protein [Eubacteriales bacterium]
MKRFIITTILIISAIITVIAGMAITRFVNDKLPSFEYINKKELFKGINDDSIPIFLEDKILDFESLAVDYEEEERIYLPLDLVLEHINPYYYWEEGEDTLIYTTLKDIVKMKVDSKNIYRNNQLIETSFPVVIKYKEDLHIAIDYLKQWEAIDYTYYLEHSRLFLEQTNKPHKFSVVKSEKDYIREEPSYKSLIITEVNNGDKVTVYDKSDDWFYVKTETGWLGYIPKKILGNLFSKPAKYKDDNVLRKEYLPQEKVNLVWHQVTNRQANKGLDGLLEDAEGIDVLSPTWFYIINSNGDIGSIADKDYVKKVHSQGYQVWALIDDFNHLLSYEDLLQDSAKREYMIKQLIDYALELNLDGINIDFEKVKKEDGQAFVQFIRELAVNCYYNEIILSVDTYVPAPWTAHYGREELGKVVDYIAIMAYDEHWATSPESGSVASVGFVEEGIINTMKEVPKEKILLGLPFYTRCWMEEEVNGEKKVSSRAYSMSYAEEILSDNNAEIIWDDNVGQYYGEYTNGDILYRIWLEEERSIEEKMKLFEKYDLAGVAGWKLSLEKENVWEVINKYVK